MGSPTPIKARRVGADFISVRPIRVAGFVLAATLVTALSLMPALPAVAAPPPMLGGIDVSKWQGTIDWTKVRTSDVRFVIMRATKGVDEVDGSFAANQAGATANHVVVGAYHRATPSAKPGDAVAEADHFVATARNAAGDLVPSLDIEETGGLPPVKLQAWVRTWVERVRERIGVRPLVYASPYFWRVAMGDTQWFAQNGYAMWIAHWGVGVNGVDVPAAGWAGKDWTVWQYTNTGRVNGITTHVDRDHLNGTNLGRVRIARLNVTPSGGGSVSGARITCGGAATRCSRLANPGDQIVLTATPDPGATFLRWTGACAGTSPACTVTTLGSRTASAVFGYPVQVSVGGSGAGTVASSPGGASCATACSVVYPYGRPVTLTARPDSASGFGAWGGDCAGANPATTCVVPVTGPTSVSVRFDAAVELAEAGAGTRFAWARRADPRALGGSYLVERRPGASVSFGFRGGGVVVSTIAGPTMGRARISIDGTSRGTFDGYAATFRAGVLHRFGGLGGGSHEVTITALGTARTGSHGTQVGVDAIRSSGVLHVSPAPGPGTWGSVAASPATDGAYVASDIAGASVQLHFHGTGATWVTAFGPAMGRAQIWVDGRTVRTVGLYAPHVAFGRDITVSGLADRAHTIRIVVLGTHGGASRGSAVAVDGWIVR